MNAFDSSRTEIFASVDSLDEWTSLGLHLPRGSGPRERPDCFLRSTGLVGPKVTWQALFNNSQTEVFLPFGFNTIN